MPGGSQQPAQGAPAPAADHCAAAPEERHEEVDDADLGDHAHRLGVRWIALVLQVRPCPVSGFLVILAIDDLEQISEHVGFAVEQVKAVFQGDLVEERGEPLVHGVYLLVSQQDIRERGESSVYPQVHDFVHESQQQLAPLAAVGRPGTRPDPLDADPSSPTVPCTGRPAAPGFQDLPDDMPVLDEGVDHVVNDAGGRVQRLQAGSPVRINVVRAEQSDKLGLRHQMMDVDFVPG